MLKTAKEKIGIRYDVSSKRQRRKRENEKYVRLQYDQLLRSIYINIPASSASYSLLDLL